MSHTWADYSTTIMILLVSITYHIHEVSIKAHRDKETKKEKKRKNHLQASTNFQLCMGLHNLLAQVQKLE